MRQFPKTEADLRRHFVIALAALMVASGLWATPATGQDAELSTSSGAFLLVSCENYFKSDNDPTKHQGGGGYCSGFINGVMNMGQLFRAICVTPDATVDEIIRVVDQRLRDNLAELDALAVGHVLAALRETYPCSQ